jgi:hypothetical protein
MSKAFNEYISDKPEINIISKEDLSLLKTNWAKAIVKSLIGQP